MKVTIKLNAAQAARAMAVMATLPSNEDLDHQAFNDDQDMVLVGNLLTYSGQRCPLWADGKGVAIEEILTGLKWPGKPHWTGGMTPEQAKTHQEACRDFVAAGEAACKAAKVISYQSSDPRLHWWETLSSYLDTRGSVNESLDELAAWGARNQTSLAAENAAARYRALAPVLIIAKELGISPARAYAQYTRAEIAQGRRFLNLTQ